MDLWRDGGPAFGLNGTLYTAELYTERAIEIIENVTEAPLFLYLGYQMTHTPLDPPSSWIGPSAYPEYNTTNRLHFNAMARIMDSGIANVTAALKRTGLWDNTLLLFTADNGAWIAGPKGLTRWLVESDKVHC